MTDMEKECSECGGKAVLVRGPVIATGCFAQGNGEEKIGNSIYKCEDCGYEFENGGE